LVARASLSFLDTIMGCYEVEKSFRDYSSDIEAVNIHYIVVAEDGVPDWSQRCTLYLPRTDDETRRITLNLPLSIESPKGPTTRYLLHYYFEIFQGGDRSYSPQFTEQVTTDLADRAKISKGI
jgi:hypothetical protein